MNFTKRLDPSWDFYRLGGQPYSKVVLESQFLGAVGTRLTFNFGLLVYTTDFSSVVSNWTFRHKYKSFLRKGPKVLKTEPHPFFPHYCRGYHLSCLRFNVVVVTRSRTRKKLPSLLPYDLSVSWPSSLRFFSTVSVVITLTVLPGCPLVPGPWRIRGGV